MFLSVLQNDVHMAHIPVVPPTTLFTLVFHITCHRHDTYISLAKLPKRWLRHVNHPISGAYAYGNSRLYVGLVFLHRRLIVCVERHGYAVEPYRCNMDTLYNPYAVRNASNLSHDHIRVRVCVPCYMFVAWF